MMRAMRLWMAAGMTSAALLAGCAPQYVNIPEQAGDVASSNVNATNVRNLEAQALRAVLEDRPVEGPVGITLPQGTDPLTYAAVASAVGDDVLTPMDDVEPASMLTVEQVRIRGTRAEVDVVRPRGTEGRQYVTVYLDRNAFSGWTVDRIRPWQGQVER
ncbi:MAG: hypothetical protein WDZ31_00555 [Phycisphaeraceae bacterium]